MKKIRAKLLFTSMLGLVFSGCVTINIYFPAAAAEKAADKIIDEVWQTQNQEGKDASKPSIQK